MLEGRKKAVHQLQLHPFHFKENRNLKSPYFCTFLMAIPAYDHMLELKIVYPDFIILVTNFIKSIFGI